jgi:hypothetical protein
MSFAVKTAELSGFSIVRVRGFKLVSFEPYLLTGPPRYHLKLSLNPILLQIHTLYLALSRILFHSALETLLFIRSHPYYAPAKLHKPDRKAHPPEQLILSPPD